MAQEPRASMWSLFQGYSPSPSCPIYLSKTPNCGLNDPFQTHIEIAILPLSVLSGKTFKSYLGEKHSSFMNGLMDFL